MARFLVSDLVITDGVISTSITVSSGLALSGFTAVSTNGLIVRTAANTYAARTLTGTAGQITVTNGDGVSGAPTISLPGTITQATTFSGITTVSNISASTSTTTGAIIVGSNVGLSGNSGGPSYFGGDLNVTTTAKKIGWNVSGVYYNWLEADGVSGNNYVRVGVGNSEAIRFTQALSAVIAGTTEATAGGAGSLTTAGGIYAAKKIIAGTSISPSASSVTWTAGSGTPRAQSPRR